LGLRGLLHDGPDGSIDAFLSGLEPELAGELRDALRDAAAPAPRADDSPARTARTDEAAAVRLEDGARNETAPARGEARR
jgi:hypothetical protein